MPTSNWSNRTRFLRARRRTAPMDVFQLPPVARLEEALQDTWAQGFADRIQVREAGPKAMPYAITRFYKPLFAGDSKVMPARPGDWIVRRPLITREEFLPVFDDVRFHHLYEFIT